MMEYKFHVFVCFAIVAIVSTKGEISEKKKRSITSGASGLGKRSFDLNNYGGIGGYGKKDESDFSEGVERRSELSFSGARNFGKRGGLSFSGARNFGKRGQLAFGGARNFGKRGQLAFGGARNFGKRGQLAFGGARNFGKRGQLSFSGARNFGKRSNGFTGARLFGK